MKRKNYVLDWVQYVECTACREIKCLDDFTKAKLVLETAGLSCWCHLKNDSLIYRNDNMEFALQNVEGLGVFIEYEQDDKIKDIPLDNKLSIMISRVKDLGLDLGDNFFVKKVEMKYLNK